MGIAIDGDSYVTFDRLFVVCMSTRDGGDACRKAH